MSPEVGLLAAVGCACLLIATLFALPTLIAFRRADSNRWLILAFNASCVGWLVALTLAVYPLIEWHWPRYAGARPSRKAREDGSKWQG